MIELSVHQLMALRCLKKNGWEASGLVFPHLLTRNGLDEEGWQALVDGGLVELEGGERWVLSPLGKREYKVQSKGKYF